MSWKDTVNGALRRSGYELRRTTVRPAAKRNPRSKRARPGDRLLEQPAFVMCTLRSGSTLLRVLLNSHSELHCPHEIHLRYLHVNLKTKWVEGSMKEMGLDQERLEYLLWDRVLQRELTSSGKPRLVTKTPNDVFIADRIKTCWPDAKLIFLLRHPAAIARSRQAYQGDEGDAEKNVALIKRYCDALEHARQTYDGVTIRYEEPDRRARADAAARVRAPRRRVGAGHARVRRPGPRALQVRPRGLEGQDQDRPDPGARASAARRSPSRSARSPPRGATCRSRRQSRRPEPPAAGGCWARSPSRCTVARCGRCPPSRAAAGARRRSRARCGSCSPTRGAWAARSAPSSTSLPSSRSATTSSW